MPTCLNCNSVVTKQYVLVFAPPGFDRPRACPRCEDKTRTNGVVRDAKGPRSNARAVED
jgi:NAD-dependent SIR2 family protein deacetylase